MNIFYNNINFIASSGHIKNFKFALGQQEP